MSSRQHKIYLDVCCLNRPLDDQTQERIRSETEAILFIMARCASGAWQWLGSEAVDFEVAQTPDPERRRQMVLLATSVQHIVRLEPAILMRAQQLVTLGFQLADSLHLACAEQMGAEVLLTTDDRLLRRAARLATQVQVRVANPATWLEEVRDQ